MEAVTAFAMLTFVGGMLLGGVLSANRYAVRAKATVISLHAIDNTLERMDAKGELSQPWVEAVFRSELMAGGLDDRFRGVVTRSGARLTLEAMDEEKRVLARVEVGP